MYLTPFLPALLIALGVPNLQAGPLRAAPRQVTQAVAAKHPFVGTWTANLSRSKLHPNYQIQRATLQFEVAGDTVTVSSAVVLASGQEQRGAETFQTDGTERPGTLNPGIVLTAKWIGPSILETRAKKDGQEIGLVTYEVSADGKTLTAKSSGTIALEQEIMFDRK